MSAPTLDGTVYLVEGRSGMYEPNFWTVNAWTTKELAEAEAARLNGHAKGFWEELKGTDVGYRTDLSDAELETYFEKRDAVIRKWSGIMGHEASTYDESEFRVYHVAVIQ